MNDGIERSSEQYFKRYNAKLPERSGARKGSPSLTPTERKQVLKNLRQCWEDSHNEHLRKHGFERDVIDCRTLKAQGSDRQPVGSR